MTITQHFAYKSLKIKGMDNLFAPVIQIRHNSAICYQLFVGLRNASRGSERIHEVAKAAYSGDVTQGSRKRMRRSINLLLQLSTERIIYNPVSHSQHPFTVNFITLTVSDADIRSHRDVMKTCLAPFLNWIRKKGAKHYIWKAELQKRGQIHYHITTNRFIHYAEIRKCWNKYQKKAGYLDDYARKHKHFDPNSTDVHAVKNIKDIEAYLIKYMVKQASAGEQDKSARKCWEAGLQYVPEVVTERIDGKVWDCSVSLSRPLFSTFINYDISDVIDVACQNGMIVLDLEKCSILKKAGVELLDAHGITEYNDFINSLNNSNHGRNAKNLSNTMVVEALPEARKDRRLDKSTEGEGCEVRSDAGVQGNLQFEN